MKTTLKKAAIAAATAGLVGAGVLTAPAPAQAAAPGNLAMVGGVECTFQAWGPNWRPAPVWQMKRWMGVTNNGGSKMTGVTITEVGGSTKMVPALPANHPSKKGPNKSKTASGELLPGQTYVSVSTKWVGCWPSSISGYTTGYQNENFNVADNFGFWANVSFQDVPEVTPPNNGTNNGTTENGGTSATG